MHALNLIWLERTELANSITVVVNCYDVASSNPDCCKCDISEWCYVDKFVRIYVLDLRFVKQRKIANYLFTIYQFKQIHGVKNITVRQFCVVSNM